MGKFEDPRALVDDRLLSYLEPPAAAAADTTSPVAKLSGKLRERDEHFIVCEPAAPHR